MRKLFSVAMALLALVCGGCATQRSPAIKAIDAAAFCEANAGLDYAACRPRNTEEQLKAALIADITLMDLEEATARRMLDLRGAADISPRAYKEPLGEALAAFIGMNDAGEVLLRPSLAIAPGKPLAVEYNRDFAWLADYRPVADDKGAPTAVVSGMWIGARMTLEVTTQADGSHQITLNSESVQMMQPVPTFTTSIGPGRAVSIQTPQVANQKRVATQDVKLSETAVFLLSAVQGENPVVRMLCVRLEKP